MPFSIVALYSLGMAVLCAKEKCSRDFSAGDAVPSLFHVMVQAEVVQGVREVEAVPLQDLGGHLAERPGVSLRLHEKSGTSKYGDWDWTVVTDDGNSQVVSAHHLDASRIDETYEVSGEEVRPLTSKITSAGHGFTALLCGWIVALGIKKIAQWRLRKTVP